MKVSERHDALRKKRAGEKVLVEKLYLNSIGLM
jgi:hypothetical protein